MKIKIVFLSVLLLALLLFLSGCTQPICGNNICETFEGVQSSPYYCQADCGTRIGECKVDADCEDNDLCTINRCNKSNLCSVDYVACDAESKCNPKTGKCEKIVELECKTSADCKNAPTVLPIIICKDSSSCKILKMPECVEGKCVLVDKEYCTKCYYGCNKETGYCIEGAYGSGTGTGYGSVGCGT